MLTTKITLLLIAQSAEPTSSLHSKDFRFARLNAVRSGSAEATAFPLSAKNANPSLPKTMPYLDPSIRLQLGLSSCPSDEAVAAAAAARGLQLQPNGQLLPIQAAKKPAPKAPAAGDQGR